MADAARPTWVDGKLESRRVAFGYQGFGLFSARQGYRYPPEEHAVVVDFVVRPGLSEATLAAYGGEGPAGPELIRRFTVSAKAMIAAGHRRRYGDDPCTKRRLAPVAIGTTTAGSPLGTGVNR
ncbi:hypothetical protein GCM10022222_15770 [Amycolatopsis ultiminotia]|uniref:Uncharacterized protein n=1 Tax=Amycolatopsis ultiminotia TaxID=543629 RepID=A0ABP6VGA8_9PSEU